MKGVLLLDANVLYSGTVGSPEGPSSRLLTLVLLGGVRAVTVENAVEEARLHLFAYFNEPRMKMHATETDRVMKRWRESPLVVHPWIAPQPALLPRQSEGCLPRGRGPGVRADVLGDR